MSEAKIKIWFKQCLKNPYIWALLVGIISLHLVRELSFMSRRAPPPLVSVGQWSLTNHKDQVFGSEELKGKVWIGSFFFTRCPTICPKLTQDMIALKKQFTKLNDKVKFVTFSVDPEFDTPEVLRAHLLKNHISDDNWIFLTGTQEQMVGVIVDQMKLHMGEREEIRLPNSPDVLFNVAHLAEFTLFDQNGDLRGKFPTDPTGLAALERAAKFLVETGAGSKS